jgi:aspartate/methionine/tyrosine aminotransferase
MPTMPDTAHAMRTENGSAQRERAVITLRAGGSRMTRLEEAGYLDPDPGIIDVSHGYPVGLTPPWMRKHQEHPPRPPWKRGQKTPPGDWLDVAPAVYIFRISEFFRELLGVPDVRLTQTCTEAFIIAVQAVMDRPGREVIVIDQSFEFWPGWLRALGARVTYARRSADGSPDVASIADAVTSQTRAIVIVSPDNPLGITCPAGVMDQIIALCKARDLTLIADHALCELNPFRKTGSAVMDALLPRRPAARNGLSWLALADTSKIAWLGGSKFGALAFSPGWRQRVEAATSLHWLTYRQHDLAVISAVLASAQSSTWELNTQIAANYHLLRDRVREPLTLAAMDAGCFALVDAAGLGLNDTAFYSLLRDRYQVLSVPVSWFPSGLTAPETRIRVSLSRPALVIAKFAEALNDCASALTRR